MTQRNKRSARWMRAALVLSLLSGTALAQAPARPGDQPGAAHYVYVESGESSNAILGYRRNSAGALTLLPGAPYATGGSGIIDPSLNHGPFDNDQSVTIDHERGLLFAVNSGSNTIAVFHINPDSGRLVPVHGSPFSSGGAAPVSVGVRGDQIVIINQNLDPNQDIAANVPNITTRHLLPGGQIVKLPGDTSLPLVQGSSPTQALVANDQPFIYNVNFFSGSLDSFQLQPNGELRANAEQPLPASEFGSAPVFGLGLWANPVARQLYVGFPTASKIGVYTWNEQGVPVFERAVPNNGALVCWFRTNRDGTRLYTANNGVEGVQQTLSVYDTRNPADPVEIQTPTLNGPGQVFQIEIEPSGQFLYAVSQRAIPSVPEGQGNALHVFSINPRDGTLTEVSSSPVVFNLPPIVRPQGVAVY